MNDINRTLSFGAFYLNPDGGQISFEYGLIFLQTEYTEEMLAAQIKMIVDTVDKHDGDLQKIAKKAPAADAINPMFG